MNEIDTTQNIDSLDLILTAGGMLAKSAAKTMVLRIFRHVILNQPDHVIERVFNSSVQLKNITTKYYNLIHSEGTGTMIIIIM